MNDVNDHFFLDTESNGEEKFDLVRYWHIILQRRWVVLTVFLISVVLCLVYLKEAPRIYQAKAQLRFEPERGYLPGIIDFNAMDPVQEAWLQTQVKLLQSDSLYSAVLKDLNWQDPSVPSLSADPVKNTRLVDVRVEHTDKEKAAVFANKLVDMFIATNEATRISDAMHAADLLTGAADEAQRKVQDAEEALQKYQQEHNSVNFETGDQLLSSQMTKYQADLDSAKSESISIQARLDHAEQLFQRGVTNSESLTVLSTNQFMADLNKRLMDLQVELQNKLIRYKEKHPDVIYLNKQIAVLENALRSFAKSEFQKMLVALRMEQENAGVKVANAQRMLDDVTKRQEEFFSLRGDYIKLRRKADQERAFYENIIGRTKEINLLKDLPTKPLKVTEYAKVPKRFIKPRFWPTLILGVIGGLGAAIGLALLLNFLDDAIKSQDDVERYLRQKFLGYVPKIQTEPGMDPRLHAHFVPQTIASEAFRTIRASLSLAYKPEQLRVLNVTSTIPSEGKTFVACNLAIVTAQTGLRTLLIDTDFRRPSLDQVFNVSQSTGLTSYLSGRVQNVDQIIHVTDVPNLDVICTGGTSSSPAEMVGSSLMLDFLREVRKRYDRVILDSPPVSAVSDPLLVSAMADGVVFVIKFNKVSREHVRRCLQQFNEAKIPVCGVISNYIDFEGRDGYYAYNNYQNRYYQTYKAAPPKGELTVEQGG
jgi:capsular exopolysaccharide synthesis family protein